MVDTPRPPSGPRGAIGAAAEDAAARHLSDRGWRILARNLRIGRDELDIVALEPAEPPVVVVVEVRSGSSGRFGRPSESVDGAKVARLYRASMTLRRSGHPNVDIVTGAVSWRVDLVTLQRDRAGRWTIDVHLKGVEPP
jgi:Holliday junction resolvase-like predicted endonuclease